MTKPIIGILGGGQLGMMLCDAAKKIGIETHIFCPDYDCPSQGRSTYFSVGDYTDKKKIIKFSNKVDYITYEFENIPIETIDFITDQKKIRPGKKSLLLTQDRLTEKKFLDELGVPIAPYKDLRTIDDISSAQDEFIDSIIKTRTLGYDGKGQFSLKDSDDPNEVFNKIINNSIIEKRIPFEFEVSVIIARDIKGNTSFFPIGKNIHENHILKHTYNPISLSENQTKKLRETDKIDWLREELNFITERVLEDLPAITEPLRKITTNEEDKIIRRFNDQVIKISQIQKINPTLFFSKRNQKHFIRYLIDLGDEEALSQITQWRASLIKEIISDLV